MLGDRRARLIAADGNVLNVDAAATDVDLRTDVPLRPGSQVVIDAAVRAMRGDDCAIAPPNLEDAAARIYGPGRYVFVTKGRSAELALAAGTGTSLGTVLTHGLFPTTARAASVHARIETAPMADALSCDLDLEWLRVRLEAKPHVGCVWLEAANNSIFGRPLRRANFEAVAAMCRRSSTLLFLDATRLLTNCVSTGNPDAAASFTAVTDGFTVSCAKESLVPDGALVCVRDEPMHRRVSSYAEHAGTILDTVDARARLAAALAEVPGSVQRIVRRAAQVETLGRALHTRGVRIVEPASGHAVFVPMASLPKEDDPLGARTAEAWLYLTSGVLTRVRYVPAVGNVMRLAVPIDRYGDGALDAAAHGVRSLFEAAPDRASFRLELLDGDDVGDRGARFKLV